MRKFVPVMLILMAGALAAGPAAAGSDKKESGKSDSGSSYSQDSGNKSPGAQDDKKTTSSDDKKSDSSDSKSTSDKGKDEGDKSSADKGKDEGDKSSADKGKDEGDKSTADKGKDEGDKSTADKGKDEGDKSTADKGKDEGDKSPGFDEHGKTAENEMEFDVKHLGDHDFTDEKDDKDPLYYKPEEQHHDGSGETGDTHGHEGEFAWEMADHVLDGPKGGSHDPEYGDGPGKLGEHESLHCEDYTNIHPTPTPVPAAVWMLGSGIAALVARRRRA